eukprot:gnl/TRDRNA2_/TRDRNA2_161480_c0_seq1.p1 gnl/TRDRNA2_/TRDRNA2_161480_c0~~gnl/TRDRNA2_/TRDRNA2_161480_c0_seq1.p1  ORF type:complete len:981 (-),score=158.73 gnl/TRDRNA2_/TRDRNA2_161480_c0_seq1:73-2973(-)
MWAAEEGSGDIGEALRKALLQVEGAQGPEETRPEGSGGPSGQTRSTGQEMPKKLPRAFGHAYATRFQMRLRHSPRPPADDAAPRSGKKKPPGVPWSAWAECPDGGLESASAVHSISGGGTSRYTIALAVPSGAALDYGSWYQVSVRISDGLSWSEWGEPTAALKVSVAPPKPEKIDTDQLTVSLGEGGSNVRLEWPLLRAHGGLRMVEYGLFVREVLHDRSEICPRQLAALFAGRAAGTGEGGPDSRETMSYEIRDLRLDVSYIFTLAARYPHVGPMEFEDCLNSAPTSLRPCTSPLPVPMQLPMPAERMRRMQGARSVLLRWSFVGLPNPDHDDEKYAVDLHQATRHYDLQALPENGKDNEWVVCKNVGRIKVDGMLAWLVKDIPGEALRCRFRLWERDTGRFGRSSPLMLPLMEPVGRIGVIRVVSESSSEIVVKAMLDAPHGSHEFVNRFQIRFRPEQVEGEWTELPAKLIWHRQNDHLDTHDHAADSYGALFSGLEGSKPAGDDAKQDPTLSCARPPSFPTVPLATLSNTGHVNRQKCLVATVGEDDGLKLNQLYVFSVRVGDLYRLSEWTEPSPAAKLSVPAPTLPSTVLTGGQKAEEVQLTITEVTEKSFTVSWPQFHPATHVGVPLHASVEYLLTVIPRPARRPLGGGRGREPEEQLPPHSQWLLASAVQASAEAPQSQLLTQSVGSLASQTAYDLKLAVRYAKLGPRRWTEALAGFTVTKRPTDEPGVAGNGTAQGTAPNSRAMPPLGPTSRQAADPPGSKKMISAVVPKTPRYAQETPRYTESPRWLPPLDPSLQSASPSQMAGNSGTKSGQDGTAVATTDLEAWTAAAQEGSERIIGGAIFDSLGPSPGRLHGSERTVTIPGATPATGEEAGPGYPPRPADHVPFWRRDPMDSRPHMPAMPSAEHPAMQLDLCQPQPPRPPGYVEPPRTNPAGFENSEVNRQPEQRMQNYPRRSIR